MLDSRVKTVISKRPDLRSSFKMAGPTFPDAYCTQYQPSNEGGRVLTPARATFLMLISYGMVGLGIFRRLDGENCFTEV